jgi:hypothetical protein
MLSRTIRLRGKDEPRKGILRHSVVVVFCGFTSQNTVGPDEPSIDASSLRVWYGSVSRSPQLHMENDNSLLNDPSPRLPPCQRVSDHRPRTVSRHKRHRYCISHNELTPGWSGCNAGSKHIGLQSLHLQRILRYMLSELGLESGDVMDLCCSPFPLTFQHK